MNLYDILQAIDQGELTGTDAIVKARGVAERCDALATELVPRSVLSTDQLAALILARVQAGHAVDVAALAYEHTEKAEAANKAIPAMREAQDQARRQLEAAIWTAASQMVTRDLRPVFESILTDVAALGPVMTDPAQVLAEGDGHVASYQKLAALEQRMRRVKQLHRELVQDGGNADAFGVFRDTKLAPVVNLVNPRSGFVVGRAELVSLDPLIAGGASVDWAVRVETAGPQEPLPRLRWLADPKSLAWLPTRSELAAHVKSFLTEQKAERNRKLVTAAVPAQGQGR